MNVREVVLSPSRSPRIALYHYANNRKSVVIVCPGFLMDKDAEPFLQLATELFLHYDVMVMDFRGHGKSGGGFTFTAKEPDDLHAVVEYARQHYEKVGVIGFSLGAAAAILYTARTHAVDGLIAVSAPTDFHRIENHFMHTDTLLPALKRFLSGSSRFFRPGNPFYKKIRPLDVIHHLAPVPTLFITGTADTIIYPWHSRKLFDHAREPKILKIIEHGAHAEELYTRHKYVFIEACTSWFNRCFANPSQRR